MLSKAKINLSNCVFLSAKGFKRLRKQFCGQIKTNCFSYA